MYKYRMNNLHRNFFFLVKKYDENILKIILIKNLF